MASRKFQFLRGPGLCGHLSQNGSFTEITMGRYFSFNPNDTFFFDIKVDVSSTSPPAANYYGISGVAFNFLDSNDEILGTVWYLAATTNYPTTNWVSASRAVNLITENVWQEFELNTESLLSQITINQAEIAKTQMLFETYSSTWPNPIVGAELWVDNVNNLSAQDGGYNVTSELWTKAVLQVPGNPVTLVWKEVGSDTTPSGDKVVSGYFYADPNDFAYGSIYNPEIFVKIYIAKNGWCNMAFNHVTVDDVMVYSAHNYDGAADKTGSVTLNSRLDEHQYDGVSLQ